MNEALAKRLNDDLMRPMMQTSWRFYLLVVFLGSIVVMGLSTGGQKHTGSRNRGGQDGPPLKSTHYCLL